MFHDVEELAAYSVTVRNVASPSKPKSGYSPRHEKRRGKPGELCNGAHRRRHKRSGL